MRLSRRARTDSLSAILGSAALLRRPHSQRPPPPRLGTSSPARRFGKAAERGHTQALLELCKIRLRSCDDREQMQARPPARTRHPVPHVSPRMVAARVGRARVGTRQGRRPCSERRLRRAGPSPCEIPSVWGSAVRMRGCARARVSALTFWSGEGAATSCRVLLRGVRGAAEPRRCSVLVSPGSSQLPQLSLAAVKGRHAEAARLRVSKRRVTHSEGAMLQAALRRFGSAFPSRSGRPWWHSSGAVAR